MILFVKYNFEDVICVTHVKHKHNTVGLYTFPNFFGEKFDLLQRVFEHLMVFFWEVWFLNMLLKKGSMLFQFF